MRAVVGAIGVRAWDGAVGQVFQLLAESRSVLGTELFHQLARLLVGRALRLRAVQAVARSVADDGDRHIAQCGGLTSATLLLYTL